ncbi:MAG: DoxX family protein [Myxococcota bacterium]
MDRRTLVAAIGHVGAGMVAIGLLPAGVMKLSGNPEMVAHFAGWGFPGFFVYLIGAVEVAAAVLTVVPRTRLIGAGIALAVMVAAAGTHLLHGEAGQMAPALVIGALAGITGWTAVPR